MTIVKSTPDIARARGLLVSHVLFQGLPDTAGLFDELLQEVVLCQVRSGEPLFHEGDKATHFLLVEIGCVEVMRYSADGEERVIQQFRSGHLVAEVATFMSHGRYPMSARAKGDTQFLRIPCKNLRQACVQHPMLAMKLLENISMRLYRNINELEWMTASTAAQRLAAYLLDLKEDRITGEKMIRLPISQRQLACRLGMRAETLSR